MRMIVTSKENDEVSPISYAGLCAILAQHLVNNNGNDGDGKVFGGSFVIGGTIYHYEVTPNNNVI